MKIRSKFKDYYDYVGQRFGEDPDCTYVRGKVPNAGKVEFAKLNRWGYAQSGNPFDRISRTDERSRIDYEVEYVVAGEMVFPVAKVSTRTDASDARDYNEQTYDVSYRLLDEELFLWIVSDVASNAWSPYRYYNRRMGEYVPREKAWESFKESLADTSFVAKCRELLVKHQVPVIKVRYETGDGCVVSHDTPILRDHGIASVVDAGAMWQNIYSTMTNVLRPNPDRDPPVEISNRDKISKAGFDLKTSFRHPVNQKKVKR